MKANSKTYPLVKDGCVTYRDITGQSFGRLEVLSRVVRYANKTGQHLHWWRCRCVCGNICHVDLQPLVNGHTQSCGCLASFSMARYGLCPAFREIIIDHRVNTNKSTAAIGRYFGLSKNSVIGILNRAGMIGQPKNIDATTTLAERLDRFIFPMYRECAYPDGKPWEPGFRWCGAPVKEESSFCQEHHTLCFVDAKQQRAVAMETAALTQPNSDKPMFRFGKAAIPKPAA